ncbi:MAG: iron-containing alcohol dehydrogenase [Thiolinea sp.]
MPNLRPIVIHQASTLDIGADSLSKVGQMTGAGTVLVITSSPVAHHVERLGITGELKLFADAPAEPDDRALTAILEMAETFKPQFVVGLGGGSVMDLAKLVAVLWDRQQTLEQVAGPNKVAKNYPP